MLHLWPPAIHTGLGLSFSIKLSSTFLLFALPSLLKTHAGQYYLPPTRKHVLAFIKDLKVRKIGGIGKVTQQLYGARFLV
jgi:Ca2+-transporting ATPase/DNA polymerase kappa